MDTARIAVLLKPFLHQSLPESQLDQISTYINLLLHWNARINLTAIRDEEEIVTRHFGESFFLARHLFPTLCHPDPEPVEGEGPMQLGPSAGNWQLATGNCLPRVLDIGSGAGFPALPLKLWAPCIHLTLVESNHKKATFLREVTRALTFTNINVINDRAESLATRQKDFRADLVTLRAVEHFERILPQAAAFLAPRGIMALLIGSAQLPHLTTLTTLKWHPPIPIPQSHASILSIGEHI
jgi:16S rRNA (guanine527-N7)-methyltransferase